MKMIYIKVCSRTRLTICVVLSPSMMVRGTCLLLAPSLATAISVYWPGLRSRQYSPREVVVIACLIRSTITRAPDTGEPDYNNWIKWSDKILSSLKFKSKWLTLKSRWPPILLTLILIRPFWITSIQLCLRNLILKFKDLLLTFLSSSWPSSISNLKFKKDLS